MSKVLVIATSAKSRGGIATVINAIRGTDMWDKFHCCWVETHIDRSMFGKVVKLLGGLVKYLCLLPFYDIVHLHFSTTVSANRKYIFYRIAKIFRKKIVVHLHCGSQLSDIWNSKYADMLCNADKCLVLSNSIRDIVAARTGRTDNVQVVYNPCPCEATDYKVERRGKIILFAATLYREKGYLDLIEAFSLVAKQYPEWKLILAGNGNQEDGRRLSAKLGIKNKVEFTGWIKGAEKEKVFRSASIFCLPSYAEGFPMAVLDAWAYGLPVVTTPVGGIPDIVENGKNGLLFKPGDVVALSEKIKMLIEHEDLRSQMSAESSRLVSTTFNVNTIANQLEDIYQTI